MCAGTKGSASREGGRVQAAVCLVTGLARWVVCVQKGPRERRYMREREGCLGGG